MSETKHATPGPWEICWVAGLPIGVGLRRNAGGSCSVMTVFGNTLDKKDGERQKAEIIANARLIAAAPDLLAACKFCREQANPHTAVREICEVAIAKAEGRHE